MLNFALKNMAIKRAKIILIVVSIVISAAVGILSYNISAQVEDGIINTTEYYDTIIGPAGSSTDLAMTTMFFTGAITETIPYQTYLDLKSDTRVNVAVPFAMGDNYNGAKIIGTTPDFLTRKEVKSGQMFANAFEAVIGYEVARANGLKIGDKFITSHGLSEGGHSHGATPLTVVGILEKTNTAYDNVIFTQLETIWEIHGTHTDEEAVSHTAETGGGHGSIIEDGDHDDEDHEDITGEICAVLIKCKSPGYIDALQSQYKQDASLLVITPMAVMREVLSNIDTSVYIIYVLCLIILIMNICNISVITLLNMYDSKKEIAMMRLIGISMKKINFLYIIQNAMIGLVSTVIAFGVSRIFLMAVRNYVSGMGIVLNIGKIYDLEWVIMAVVAIISVLPTVICTLNMSKKDGITE